MSLEPRARIRAHAVAIWQKARNQFVRLPATVRVMLSLFLLAALLMALHTAFLGKDASLQLKVQHSLRSAQLSVWVDGDLAYSGTLVGNTKKRFGLIPSIQGNLLETVPVTPGAHQIKVRIVSDGGMHEDAISGDFARNGQRTLSVSASRADVSLGWQSLNGNSQSATEASESSSGSKGWFSRYAGTLIMTVAGSIISALTGFALRELPKQLVSRTSEAVRLNNQAGSD
jgi:hypothetical protein